MASLTSGSIQQLLTVLQLTRRNSERGIPLPRAYHDAVRDVSNRHHVTYQTIGDFRRRLGYSNVEEYLESIRTWLRGDPDSLRRRLISHSDSSSHDRIKDSLRGGTSLNTSGGLPPVSRREGTEQSPAIVPTTMVTLEEVRIRMPSDLRSRIHLAQLANLGPTFEETAIALLERGFEAEKQRIKEFLTDL